MTERRDRLADAESAPSGRRPALVGRALAPHLSRRRLAIAAAALSAAIGLVWLALWIASGARDWLHRRSEYAIPFDQIVLSPPPPEEVRGGAKGLLDRVKRRAKLDDPIRLLEIDLDDLGRAFAKYAPWIARVERVDRAYPNHLTVRVAYHRRPVARVKADLDPTTFLAVTDSGIAIPGEDVDPNVLASLPILSGLKGLDEARPGRFVGLDAEGEMRPEMTSALALARFLAEVEAGSKEPPRVKQIDMSSPTGSLLARTRRGHWVLWGHAPGQEDESEPSAKEKLQLLKRWQVQNPKVELPEFDYLYFMDGRLEIGHGRDPKK